MNFIIIFFHGNACEISIIYIATQNRSKKLLEKEKDSYLKIYWSSCYTLCICRMIEIQDKSLHENVSQGCHKFQKSQNLFTKFKIAKYFWCSQMGFDFLYCFHYS